MILLISTYLVPPFKVSANVVGGGASSEQLSLVTKVKSCGDALLEHRLFESPPSVFKFDERRSRTSSLEVSERICR